MINYIEHKNIDRIKWDTLIDQALNRNYYAYSWYLDLVCKHWDALIEDDYVSVMPVTKGRKFLFNYVYQPMFAQQLGVFSIKKITQPLVDSFLKLLSERFNYIELNLNYENNYSYDGFSCQEMINYEIDLNKSFIEIRKGYNLNTTRQVKKSHLNNLSIEKIKDVIPTINMFKKNKGHVYTNIKPKNYQTLQNLTSSLIQMNKAEVWHVVDNTKTVLAGAFFFLFEDRVVFSFSGRTEKARKEKAMHFLFDKFLEEYSNKMIIFDFAGSNDPGVGLFYKSFGAVQKKYLRIKKNNLPFFIKWLKK